MYKIIKKFGLASAFVGILLASTTANATLITDTVEQDYFVNNNKTYKYYHDLTDDGFDPNIDTAISGMLEIQFYDDAKDKRGRKKEKIQIRVDFDKRSIINSASVFIDTLEVKAITQINKDGKLRVKVKSKKGDFYVGDSVLSIVTNKSSGVPAPAILGILGIGLLGICAAGSLRKVAMV